MHIHLLIKILKLIFEPIFKQEEIPYLSVFYPSPEWFKEQQLGASFSTEKRKINVPSRVSYSLLATMIFWEFKPGKIITVSFLFLLALMLFRPLLPPDSYFGLFCFGFISLLLSNCFAADNLSDGFEYILCEIRNKLLIKKLYQRHTHYNSFIEAYNRKNYYKLNIRLVTFMAGIFWLILLASIITLGVIAWRY